jgi:hypothetical protein
MLTYLSVKAGGNQKLAVRMELQAKDISRMSCQEHYRSHEARRSCWPLFI